MDEKNEIACLMLCLDEKNEIFQTRISRSVKNGFRYFFLVDADEIYTYTKDVDLNVFSIYECNTQKILMKIPGSG